MGGSILPTTIHNGKIYFLFGKERDIDENPGWSDFGGGTDKGETFIQTAIREGGEELTGFLGNDSDIRKMLHKYGTYTIDYKSEGYDTYRCHIFPMEYDHLLPHYYNNNQQFLQKRLDPKIIRDTKIFEKTQIKWFSFNDMKKQRNNFRSFYKNIVDLLLENKAKIEIFINKKFRKQTNKSLKKGLYRQKSITRKSIKRR
jgi:8-oxo-dGTP pyrophosphatase MutT (NUDIX family)